MSRKKKLCLRKMFRKNQYKNHFVFYLLACMDCKGYFVTYLSICLEADVRHVKYFCITVGHAKRRADERKFQGENQ